LRNDKCPVCRCDLKGRNIGPKLLRVIQQKKRQDKFERESRLDPYSDSPEQYASQYAGFLIYNVTGGGENGEGDSEIEFTDESSTEMQILRNMISIIFSEGELFESNSIPIQN